MGINKNFVVKNGLEVSTDLILADSTANRVGIATTAPKYLLHVLGGIGATDVNITGIATISDLVVSGNLSIGSSSGSDGQYLKSTGTGVEWADFPVGRSSTSVVAAAGQSLFEVAYSVGLVDVFVNGIRLSTSEFTATDGVTIQLTDGCYGGENVDILAYAVEGLGIGATGITGLTIREEGVTVGNPQGVTSINFVGATVTAAATGAGLTVTISGSGGGGGDIYWGSTTAGIHTTSNVGVGTTNPTSALTVKGNTSLETLNVSGVSTLSTTNISGDLTFTGNNDLYLKDDGVINLGNSNDLQISHNGSLSIIRDGGTGGLLIDSDNEIKLAKNGTGNDTLAIFTPDGPVELYYDNSKKFETLGAGVTVTGTTFTNNLSVSGVGTFGGASGTGVVDIQDNSGGRTYIGPGSITFNNNGAASIQQSSTTQYFRAGSSGISVYYFSNYYGGSDKRIFYVDSAGPTELYYGENNKRLETLGVGVTITGITFTDQLSVSGVSTFINDVNLNSGNLKVATNGIIKVGSSDQLEIYYDGLQTIKSTGDLKLRTTRLLVSSADNSEQLLEANQDGSVALYYDNSKKFETTGAGVTITGTTFTNQLSVSGISTFNDQVDFGGGTQIISSGEVKLDNLSRIMLGYSGGTPNGLVIRQNSSSDVSEIVNVGGDDIQIQADSGRSVFIGNDNTTNSLTVTGAGVTVTGTTFTNQLSVSGVSTFSGNISVAGTVTADTMVFTNDGGSSLNGSLTINNVSASYTELLFRDSSGSVQSNIQGGTNLSLNPGGSGYISLGTYSLFYPNGDVTLNNGNQGTTLIRNQVHVQSGITSFYDNVSVGGTITVNTGDISVGVSTANGVILTSQNGTRYRLIVANDGTLSTIAV